MNMAPQLSSLLRHWVTLQPTCNNYQASGSSTVGLWIEVNLLQSLKLLNYGHTNKKAANVRTVHMGDPKN